MRCKSRRRIPAPRGWEKSWKPSFRSVVRPVARLGRCGQFAGCRRRASEVASDLRAVGGVLGVNWSHLCRKALSWGNVRCRPLVGGEDALRLWNASGSSVERAFRDFKFPGQVPKMDSLTPLKWLVGLASCGSGWRGRDCGGCLVRVLRVSWCGCQWLGGRRPGSASSG